VPYCPKCKYEYERTVHKCPDCDVELVPELPPEREHRHSDNVRAVLILKTGNYLKAQLLVGALEEAGIPTWSKRIGLGRLGGSITSAITHGVMDVPGIAEVYVNPSDLERAREIKRQLEPDGSEGEDEYNLH
jgi:hypothetical protein